MKSPPHDADIRKVVSQSVGLPGQGLKQQPVEVGDARSDRVEHDLLPHAAHVEQVRSAPVVQGDDPVVRHQGIDRAVKTVEVVVGILVIRRVTDQELRREALDV